MNILAQQPGLVHYLPIGSTILSAIFCAVLLRRYFRGSRGTHLLWWAGGVFCYGLGTAIESSITLFGNGEWLFKSWYVAGALLGGYPLAQGTVYLLLSKRTAHTLSAITVPFIVVFGVLTFLSPINADVLEAHRPSGAALGWSWIRLFTPIINLYAVIFLVGGAVLSAVKYAQTHEMKNRAIGNALIAFGALLPGIGGTLTKAGYVEALYIGEFFGIIAIWMGYAYCVKATVAVHPLKAREADAEEIERVSPQSASPEPVLKTTGAS